MNHPIRVKMRQRVVKILKLRKIPVWGKNVKIC